MNRLDIFSRFWFPILYIIWLNITLYMLDQNIARFTVLNFLILAVIAGYCTMKVRQVKREQKFTT